MTAAEEGENIATQEVEEAAGDSEDEDDPNVWGTLLPLRSAFRALKLSEARYTVGRNVDCDYVLGDGSPSSQDKLYRMYSQKQFQITKEDVKGGPPLVLLEDDSANGTFINGKKIGKGKQQLLSSGDLISLALPNNQVFSYQAKGTPEPFPLPDEFSKKYFLDRQIGSGACGTVRLCFAKGDFNSRFAVKIIEKKTFSCVVEGDQNDWNRKEVDIVTKLDHPNIVKMFGVIENDERVFMILEYIDGGDLFPWIQKFANEKPPDRCLHIKSIFAQMVLAVKYLHDKGVTHRDLKPENILVKGDSSAELIVKVTDFGLSKLLTEKTVAKTFCGTPGYLAPEVVKASENGYTEAVDCWSLGVVLFVLLVNYPPFSNAYGTPVMEQILAARVAMYEQAWIGVDPEAHDLVSKLIEKDPIERFTADDALEHLWLKDDVMKKNLVRMIPDLKWEGKATITNGKRRSRALSSSPALPVTKKVRVGLE